LPSQPKLVYIGGWLGGQIDGEWVGQ
jgi:hypothetical protein